MANLSCVVIQSHISLNYLDYAHMKINAKTFLIPLTNIYVKITVILKQAE